MALKQQSRGNPSHFHLGILLTMGKRRGYFLFQAKSVCPQVFPLQSYLTRNMILSKVLNLYASQRPPSQIDDNSMYWAGF